MMIKIDWEPYHTTMKIGFVIQYFFAIIGRI